MSNKPKVVLDTSIYVSSFLTKTPLSAPNQIISLWKQGHFILIMTPQLRKELIIVLSRKGIEPELIKELVKSINRLALHSEGAYQTNFLDSIDANDNIFLSACYESKADYLVSLDKHLLNLKHFHQTLIFNPHSFLNQLSQF